MVGQGKLAVTNSLSACCFTEVRSAIGGFCLGPLLADDRLWGPAPHSSPSPIPHCL